MLADMATHVEGLRWLVYRAVFAARRGIAPAPGVLRQMAKLFASDTAMRVTVDCVQLLGGIGYTRTCRRAIPA